MIRHSSKLIIVLPASGRTRDVSWPACQGLCRADIDWTQTVWGVEEEKNIVVFFFLKKKSMGCQRIRSSVQKVCLWENMKSALPSWWLVYCIYTFRVDSVVIPAKIRERILENIMEYDKNDYFYFILFFTKRALQKKFCVN